MIMVNKGQMPDSASRFPDGRGFYPADSNGLYSPSYEHDGCGVGLVVKIDGSKHHSIVDQGLKVLEHMAHRGAEGADNKTVTVRASWCRFRMNTYCLTAYRCPRRGGMASGWCSCPRMTLTVRDLRL